MRVRPLADGGVRLLILPVQCFVESCEDRCGIGEVRQPRALEELRLVLVPALPADEVIVQRTVFVRSFEVEIACLDRPGDMTEQKDLVEGLYA